MREPRMIRTGAAHFKNLQLATRIERRTAQHVEELFFAYYTRAGAGQE
jgi:hypothetical protein